jgi:hypothetical protein
VAEAGPSPQLDDRVQDGGQRRGGHQRPQQRRHVVGGRAHDHDADTEQDQRRAQDPGQVGQERQRDETGHADGEGGTAHDAGQQMHHGLGP